MSPLADALDMAANLDRHGPRPERRVRWCWCRPQDGLPHPHDPCSWSEVGCPPERAAWKVRREQLHFGLAWTIRKPGGELAGWWPADTHTAAVWPGRTPVAEFPRRARLAAHRWAADR